jgi:hypothetical protein
MNASRLVHGLLLILLGAGCFLLFAGAAPAADGISTPILQANIIYELAADRSRMIQISMVFVALGCALIWWYR